MKYQAEGGPRFADLFGYLTLHSIRPAQDRIALLRATLFNVLVGNADAHGKNYGLLRDGDTIRMAPLYDVLSTLVYPDLSPRYAMKVGGKGTFREVHARHWERFARDGGLAPAQVRRELSEMARRLPGAMEETRAGLGPSAVLDRIVEEATTRAAATLQELQKR